MAIACVSRGSCAVTKPATSSPTDAVWNASRRSPKSSFAKNEMIAVAASTSRTIWTTLRHRDAAELRQLRRLRLRGRRAAALRRPSMSSFAAAGGRAQIAGERCGLDEGQRAAQLVRSQRRARAWTPRVSVPAQDRQADQQLGVVGGQDVGVRGGGRVGEVGQRDRRRPRGQRQRSRAEVQVCDAHGVQRAQRPPGRGRDVGADRSRLQLRHPAALGDQHQRLIGPRPAAGRQHPPHRHVARLGEQRRQRLALDAGHPRQRQRRAAVAVHQRPPQRAGCGAARPRHGPGS